MSNAVRCPKYLRNSHSWIDFIINCLIIIHLSFPENLLSWSILYDAIDIFDFTCFIIYVSERILGIVSLCLVLLNQKLACLLAICVDKDAMMVVNGSCLAEGSYGHLVALWLACCVAGSVWHFLKHCISSYEILGVSFLVLSWWFSNSSLG